MQIVIPLKPMSVNFAWQGKRFKSKAYKQFIDDFTRVVPFGNYDQKCKENVYVFYAFYISEYVMSDVGNFEKPITDLLVTRGYLMDDRYIKTIMSTKERVDKGNEYISVYITNNPDDYLRFITDYWNK